MKLFFNSFVNVEQDIMFLTTEAVILLRSESCWIRLTVFQRNEGRYYTNKELEQAEKSIQERMEQLLKENPKMKHEEARKNTTGLSGLLQLQQ